MSSLHTLPLSRDILPTQEFRAHLRQIMLEDPALTLRRVASILNVSRQCVSNMVGKLHRPTCATTTADRPAPKRDEAAVRLSDLQARVASGESAAAVAADLGISLTMAMRLGFRSREVRPTHGTQAKLKAGCNCWRCRQAAGLALPRGPRVDVATKAAVLDWLAYVDPDTGEGLSQAKVGKMVGIGQMSVNRIARGAAQ